jgi:hypothetical protein
MGCAVLCCAVMLCCAVLCCDAVLCCGVGLGWAGLCLSIVVMDKLLSKRHKGNIKKIDLKMLIFVY